MCVNKIQDNVIEATILIGKEKVETEFIPQIPLILKDFDKFMHHRIYLFWPLRLKLNVLL